MLTAFKRIPELFPFPMAKKAYCKQYATVLLPIFAYAKSHEEGRREKGEVSSFSITLVSAPSLPLAHSCL